MWLKYFLMVSINAFHVCVGMFFVVMLHLCMFCCLALTNACRFAYNDICNNLYQVFSFISHTDSVCFKLLDFTFSF